MKFKLLDGKHQEPTGDLGEVFTTYRKGDIVESESDLCKMFNSPGSRKFLKLSNDTPARLTPPPIAKRPEEDPEDIPTPEELEAIDTLESTGEETLDEDSTVEDVFTGLTIAQLQTIAEEEEIDLEGVTLKADILKIMRSHTGV